MHTSVRIRLAYLVASSVVLMVFFVGCESDGGGLEVVDASGDFGSDVDSVSDTHDSTDFRDSFSICDPFTSDGCAEGESCVLSSTEGFTCTLAGDGDEGERCDLQAKSDCMAGLTCVVPEKGQPCCSPYCSRDDDCDEGVCRMIRTFEERSIGYCAGLCEAVEVQSVQSGE